MAGCNASEPSALEAEIIRLQSAENIGAIAYGVVSAHKIIASATLGFYSRDDKREINMESLFRIGSISKTFTALGALILEHESELELSSPAKLYLSKPPYKNLWRKKYPITGAQLLEHTAGFRDMTRKEFDQLRPLPLAEAFLLNPKSRVTAWPPGRHSSYSNSGAGVLTALIEAVSGNAFDDFMEAKVFNPLALHSASFAPPPEGYRALVRGYDSDGVTPLAYWHQLYPAFGALNISTKDMLRFAQFLLNEGGIAGRQVVPRALVRQMPYPTTSLAARAGLQYGYGKGLYQFQHDGITFIGHGGDADGYLSFLAYSLALNRGYFVVINAYKQVAMKKIRHLIQEFIVDGAEVEFPEVIPASQEIASRLLGEYEETTTRFVSTGPARRMVISRNASDEFYTRIDNKPATQLLPVFGQFFRRRWHSIPTIAVVQSDGETYIQGDFGNFKKIRTVNADGFSKH